MFLKRTCPTATVSSITILIELKLDSPSFDRGVIYPELRRELSGNDSPNAKSKRSARKNEARIKNAILGFRLPHTDPTLVNDSTSRSVAQALL